MRSLFAEEPLEAAWTTAERSDRIRIHEAKPQQFGSNFDLRAMKPTPIEDPEHVDKGRAKGHLMPMPDYTCEMRQFYRQ
jgi:hypothetical protein